MIRSFQARELGQGHLFCTFFLDLVHPVLLGGQPGKESWLKVRRDCRWFLSNLAAVAESVSITVEYLRGYAARFHQCLFWTRHPPFCHSHPYLCK